MADRPILFSAPMVRALLAGTKTQTRRVIKPQPTGFIGGPGVTMPNGTPAPLIPMDETVAPFGRQINCPHGNPGDRLWVRETCRADELPDGLDGVRYLADDHFEPIKNTEDAADKWVAMHHYRGGNRRGLKGPTVPPIHMPRWASRITLEITGRRVERLQDISDDDLDREGLQEVIDAGVDHDGTPRDAWRALWSAINGPDSWAANPWVWVIEFGRVAP